MPKLHEALAAGRRKAKLSYAQLTEKTGLGGATLLHIEHGKMREPSFFKITRIARALGLSLEVLADAEMQQLRSDAFRKKLAARMRRTRKDPKALKKILAGNAKGARHMNKTITPEVRQRAVVRAQETRLGVE